MPANSEEGLPANNEENTDIDGLGAFAVALASQQAAFRAAAGEVDTEEEASRAAAFMDRALSASARMTTAYNKDMHKIEKTRAALSGKLEEAIAEHTAEALLLQQGPDHAGTP